MARIVQIRWFGTTTPATVVGYDFQTSQIRVQFTGGNGSCYCTDDELSILNEPSPQY